MRGTSWLKILRDLICLAAGTAGMIFEETRADPDILRLILFGIMMTAPGVLAAAWLRSYTESPSSQSPSTPSSPASESGSSSTKADR